MSKILASALPIKQLEECGEIIKINCDEEDSPNTAPSGYEVVFPIGAGQKLPLSGGAIVTLDFGSIKTDINSEAQTLLIKEVGILSASSFSANIDGLVQARIIVNTIIYEVGKHAALDNSPQIFISTLSGDDSNLNPDSSSADVTKICELRYIPVEILIAIGNAFSSLEDAGNFGTLESPLYGASGLTFKDFTGISASLPNLTIAAMIDLLPFYNIEEQEIVKRRGKSPTGGYYTVVGDIAYLKIPDLSGRDSAGFDPDLYNEDEQRNLYFEILSDSVLSRITITDIAPPPYAIVSNYEDEFPTSGTFIIEVESESEIEQAYLSLIVNDITVPKVKGMHVYGNGIELVTIPMLTKPISSSLGASNPTWSYENYIGDAPSVSLSKYFNIELTTLQSVALAGEYGKLSTDNDNISLSSVLGEQNRPEILLGDRSQIHSIKQNDKKYYNPKMTMARDLLAQTRPRLYESENIPVSWVAGSVSGGNGTQSISFKAADLNSIIQRGETTEFALYITSGNQITRVPGPNISLRQEVPSITSINPNGFAGSDPIEESRVISISGESLSNVYQVVFSSEDSGIILSFNISSYSDGVLTSVDSEVGVLLGTTAFSIINIPDTILNVYVETSGGMISNSLPIYIRSTDSTIVVPPEPRDQRIDFVSEEFTSASFSNNPSGIPLLSDGQSAEIKIRSKSKVFSGKYPVYAYLALPNSTECQEIMNEFDLNIRTFSSESILVAAGIEFQLSKNKLDNFYSNSKKTATIKFPGSDYYGYNFSRLAGQKTAYLLFTNDSLTNLTGDGDSFALTSNSYSLLTLGQDSTSDPNDPPAFVNPGYITGVVAEVGNDLIYSLTNTLQEDLDIKTIFDGSSIRVGDISVYQAIPKLALIFSGTDMPRMRKRHDFYLGGEKLSKIKLAQPLSIRDNGKEVLAVFKNINSKNEGALSLGVEVNDKRFNVKYNSSSVYASSTSCVKTGAFGFNVKDRSIATSKSIVNDGSPQADISLLDSYIVNSSTIIAPLDSLMQPLGDGIITQDPSSITYFLPYNPISIASQQGDITLKIYTPGDLTESDTKIIAGATKDDISILNRQYLEIPNGSIYRSGQYLADSLATSEITKALLFNRVRIDESASIKFNVPEIIGMGLTQEDLSKEVPVFVPVRSGVNIYVRVKNVKKNFSIKVGDVVLKTVSPIRVSNQIATFDAQFIVPPALAGTISIDDCIIICASGTNSDRMKAKKMFGSGFVESIEDRMNALLLGLAGKVPDIDDLKELLKNSPLRFLQINLDVSLVPTELINNFCNLSFQLLADLKLALNGFQVLMIPIQVIFCIIDVLCSLLNPVKTAKAMIRLFECLYDLVLLLPQISIPVMFLQLILHLLELLKCVIDKILGVIVAINEIVAAIQKAIIAKSWASLRALEEVLSEYLFTLNVDLDILAPVIAILSIFLQLLQLVFRFPCEVTPNDGSGDCLIDGTMLAGLVQGVVAPDEAILSANLIPVAQVYTEDSIETAVSNGGSTPIYPVAGDVIAVNSGPEETYYDDMKVDEETLRSTNNRDFNISMGVSTTKSKKGFKNPAGVEFEFKSRYANTFFVKNKIFGPDQSGDSPLLLIEEDGSNELKIASGYGNFVSPIDIETFITIKDDKGTVKSLEQKILVPIYEVDEETAEVTQAGTETVTRTFDRIPKMAILDDEFNLYFIEENGIIFENNNEISSIKARMVNGVSAPKHKFSKEEQDVDINLDGTIDEDDASANVYDFPQIYFVDMRSILSDINAFCDNASMNSFILDEDNTAEITQIIEESKTCLDEFMAIVKGFGTSIRNSMNEGKVPDLIDVPAFQTAVASLIACLGKNTDDICIYVVNSLNTSFKVFEDQDLTPSEKYIVPVLSSEILDSIGYAENPPAITGATEYADGDGDNAIINSGGKATIIVVPRDAMDVEIGGDLSDKISLEIVSDQTGTAEIIVENNIIFTKSGSNYIAYVTATGEGEVKLRAKVCNRTIQALTYFAESDLPNASDSNVDCIKDVSQTSVAVNVSGLIKVDRIISVFFINRNNIRLSESENAGTFAQSTPQTFGTKLEN